MSPGSQTGKERTRASVSLAALRIAVRLSVIHHARPCPPVIRAAEHCVSQASRSFLPGLSGSGQEQEGRPVTQEAEPARRGCLFWSVPSRRGFYSRLHQALGFPGGASGKEPACQCWRHKKHGFDPWVRKIPWRRAWQPTLVFLPGESTWTEEPSGLPSRELHRVGHD